MLKLSVALAIACGYLLVSVCAEEAAKVELGERHTEAAGGYSFAAPKGWQFKKCPQVEYKVAVKLVENEFAPNIIIVVDEMFNGSLSDYVVAAEKQLEKVLKDYKKLSQTELKTDAGSPAIKLIITDEQQEKKVRQPIYFLDGPLGKKLVFSCTALAEGGEKLDPVFEASFKTFKLEKSDK